MKTLLALLFLHFAISVSAQDERMRPFAYSDKVSTEYVNDTEIRMQIVSVAATWYYPIVYYTRCSTSPIDSVRFELYCQDTVVVMFGHVNPDGRGFAEFTQQRGPFAGIVSIPLDAAMRHDSAFFIGIGDIASTADSGIIYNPSYVPVYVAGASVVYPPKALVTYTMDSQNSSYGLNLKYVDELGRVTTLQTPGVKFGSNGERIFVR